MPVQPYLRSAGTSPTLAMNERARALEAQGRTVYKFGFGQSPFAPPEHVVAALREHAPAKDYVAVRGIPALREAVAEYHRRQGMECKAEDVLVGPGSKQLMFLLMLALEVPEVVIPAPSWVSYAPQARLLGRNVRWIRTGFEDGWRLRAEALGALEPGSLLVLNYPNNPTGLTYTVEELRVLASACRERGLLVLSDEIYAELHHAGEHRSIAEFYPEGTFVTGGLSKWCGAGGWRVGTIRIPAAMPEVREALAIAASETHSCVATPMQLAAVAAYKDVPAMEAHLSVVRERLRDLGRACIPILRSAGIAVRDAECAFYLFPDFSGHKGSLAGRGIHSSEALCERLLEETGVALLAGTAFGMEPGDLQARLAYVEEPAKTLEGVRRLAEWVSP